MAIITGLLIGHSNSGSKEIKKKGVPIYLAWALLI